MKDERRDGCKLCGHALPPDKTSFCSELHAHVYRRRARRDREVAAGKVSESFGRFMTRVRKPIPLKQIAALAERDLADITAGAERDVADGKLIGYWRNGVLTYVGRPLQEGELTEEAERKAEKSKAERRFEKREREKLLLQKRRASSKRNRQNRRERKGQTDAASV